VLCVPEADLDPLLLAYNEDSKNLVVGSGHTPGFGARFGAERMRSYLETYRIKAESDAPSRYNDLYVSVGFLGADDQNRLGSAMRARNVEDAWYAKGACVRPAVTTVAGSTYFQIQCAPNDSYASIWDRTPDSAISMPEPNSFVIATCSYDTPQVGPYAGRQFRTCSRVVKLDGFLVDFHIQEENLALIPRIDGLVRGKIAEWKANCQKGL